MDNLRTLPSATRWGYRWMRYSEEPKPPSRNPPPSSLISPPAHLSDDDDILDDTGQSKIVEGGVRRGDQMARAMDELNLVLMLLSGTTPDEVARKREKEMEEQEQKAQEAGKRKVAEWLQTDTQL